MGNLFDRSPNSVIQWEPGLLSEIEDSSLKYQDPPKHFRVNGIRYRASGMAKTVINGEDGEQFIICRQDYKDSPVVMIHNLTGEEVEYTPGPFHGMLAYMKGFLKD